MDFLPLGHVRTDPVLDPDCLSDHVHTYYGASVDLRPELTYDDLRKAEENSGNVEENKSLYWHNSVYVVEDGVYKLAPIYFSSAYYVWTTGETTAIPDGFSMIVRGSDKKARVEVVCDGPSDCERDDCSSPSSFFPKKACAELEVKIVFPTCWDGVRLSSANGMDHVSFDTEGGWFDADCPASHPVKLPEIHFYFRIFDYLGGHYAFSDGSDEFHADYMSGWDESFLQGVLDECANESDAASPDAFCEDILTFRDKKNGQKPDDDIRAALLPLQPSDPFNPRATVSAEEVSCVSNPPRGKCDGSLLTKARKGAPFLDPTDLEASCDDDAAKADAAAVIADAGNACPSGFAKLTSVAACRAAMDLVGFNGEEFNGDEDEPSWPSGCYECDGVKGCTDGFWFNEHPTGAAKDDARPVCGKGLEPLPDTTSILFVGDSDVDYWQTATYEGSRNVGVGGYEARDVKDEMDDMLAAFGPGLKWVVVVCGENDLWSTKPGKVFSRFKSIADKAVATGARLLYMGTKPEPSTSSIHSKYRSYDKLIREYATSLAAATDGPPPLVMVDVYPAFEALGNPNSFYRGDKLHLSGDGYALWDQWAQTALDDASGCVRWLRDACDEFASADPDPDPDPDVCADDPAWRARKFGGKKKYDCEWVDSKKRKKRKKRCKKTGSHGVKAKVACCATCAKK